MQPEQPVEPSNQPVVNPEIVNEIPVSSGTTLPEQQPIQWQAPEYLQEYRSPWWFIGFWGVVIVLMLIAIILIKSWSFALLIPAMAAALTIYSHRPPRQVGYVLSNKGLYINEKLHTVEEFKSFSVVREESMPSIMLIPTRRFRPAITVYFPIEAGEGIVDLLGSRMPMQEAKLDFFDKLIRQLHL